MTTNAPGADYVHGYSQREAERLADQAGLLRDVLQGARQLTAGCRVLEVGSGTGEQTALLLDGCPGLDIVCIDIDAGQLAAARARLERREGPITGSVQFRHDDVLRPGALEDQAYDHAFVRFVLEHLARPGDALAAVRRAVRPGGTVLVTEGDHGSCRFYPETPASVTVWDALVAHQRRRGGDPMIGRRLYGLLAAAGFVGIEVSPRLIYVDAGKAALRDGFVRRIITPMVDGVRTAAIAAGLDEATWRQGIAELEATASGSEGVFCYTFFQATARVP